VGDLIEALEGHNREARVVLGTQPNYPFECGIDGVVTRKDGDPEAMKCDDCGGTLKVGKATFLGVELHDAIVCDDCGTKKSLAESDERPDDVFILESGQIRYASSKLWDAS